MSHEPRILITAGPTLEHLDPVRSILNRSSGKMGLALAKACSERLLPVHVLLGPVETAIRDEFQKYAQVAEYQTSQDLHTLLNKVWPSHDVLFMAAAVSDLRPSEISNTKLARSAMSIELEPVPDLLASLAKQWPDHGIRVGFALEPADQLVTKARRKLEAKACHAIAANPLSTVGADAILGTWITPEETVTFAEMSKSEYAAELLDRSLYLRSITSG